MRSTRQIRIASFRVVLGFALVALLVTATTRAGEPRATDESKLTYHLTYSLEAPTLVHISIHFAQPAPAPLTLIIPRSVPGGYAQRPYDPFVANVKAFSESAPHASTNDAVSIDRDELAPRWIIGKQASATSTISRIEYDVDVAKMERDIFSAADTSRSSAFLADSASTETFHTSASPVQPRKPVPVSPGLPPPRLLLRADTR